MGYTQGRIELFNLFRLSHIPFLDSCLGENPHGYHHEDAVIMMYVEKSERIGDPLQ
jgi:hypothetical protein